MNLSVISKKVAQYPVPFVCGILIPLILVLLIMRGPKVTDFQDKLPALEKEWKNMQTNIERSANLEVDIELLEAGLETINSRLMDVEDVAINYDFFYALEEQAGVVLKQFSQGTATEGEDLPIGRDGLRNFSVIPYDVAMDGTLPQILKFLDLLDRQEHIVRLNQLNITRPSQENEGSNMLSARLWCHVLAAKNE